MSRRASTSLEKATTPRGEDFLANPKLKAALETLGKLARTELGDEDTDFPFGAIRDGAAMLAATEFDVWQVTKVSPEREGELMPHSEAIQELIAAAKIAQGWMTQPSRLAGTNMEEPCKSIHRRLGTAIDRVEAEEKPQELNINVAVTDLSQYHQIGGK
jgi:hypothetical protein